jgi:acetolactate synthase-1/2/3 large subunit
MDYEMPVINRPHEQVAGHLADGITRITRKPAVCIVGPEEFANAVPAMMEAWGERSPVIFVTGSSTFKRQGAGGFKEIDDVGIATPLTKYSVSITDGTRIYEFADRSWRTVTYSWFNCECKKPGHYWWSGTENKLENTARELKIPVFNVPYHQKLLGEEPDIYMGLADFHQYQPSKHAIHNSDVVIMVGGQLDNQMNFGTPLSSSNQPSWFVWMDRRKS